MPITGLASSPVTRRSRLVIETISGDSGMKHSVSLKLKGLLLAAPLLFAGCASLDEAGANLKAELAKAAEKSRAQNGGTAGRKGIAGSELDGIFKKYPITDTRNPERFPRVAITIKSASPGVFASNAVQNTLRDTDCVTFDVRLWKTAKDGQSFNDLVICAREMYPKIQNVPMFQIPNWDRRLYWPGDKNSGAVRTEGPTPPGTLFPNGAQYQNAWLDGLTNAKFFIGAMLVELGYDWNDVHDRRVWIVSAPTR